MVCGALRPGRQKGNARPGLGSHARAQRQKSAVSILPTNTGRGTGRDRKVGREEGKRKVVFVLGRLVGRMVKQETLVKAAWLLLKPPLLKPLFFQQKQPIGH